MVQGRNEAKPRNTAFIYTPVAVLLVVFLSAFGISVFFRVTTIAVSGAVKFSPEEIISKSGLKAGDNLMFVNSAAARRKLAGEPYISDAKIVRTLPDAIEIIIEESVPAATVNGSGEQWLIDADATILERREPGRGAPVSGCAAVTGISPVFPVPGGSMAVAPESETGLRYLKEILGDAGDKGILGGLEELDISNISGITLVYRGITVTMGSGENAGYKLDRMLGAIEDAARKNESVSKIDVSRDGHTSVS
ncbi:MAG: FtsQ-type POTRA domain-containing protein [Oscillospiraceae bacterium]|nr:FtsQ-type POTRA domain-containing protein [Oscillospiraceae bacterium]